MDWTPIDIYCERVSAAFWAEPFNALTNIAFILAAIVGYAVAKRHGRLDFVNGLLIALAATIGVGSFLFHTYANKWSMWADMIPIAILAVVYIAFSVRVFFKQSWIGVGMVALAFFFISAVLLYFINPLAADGGPLSFLNGSQLYAPILLGLLAMAFFLQQNGHQAARLMWVAVVTFLVSINFRSIDMAICDSFPLGTHFLWHSLNGVLIGLLLVAIIRFGATNKSASSS